MVSWAQASGLICKESWGLEAWCITRFLLCIKHCASWGVSFPLLKTQGELSGEAGGEQSAWPCGRGLLGINQMGAGRQELLPTPPCPCEKCPWTRCSGRARKAAGPLASQLVGGARQSGMGGRRETWGAGGLTSELCSQQKPGRPAVQGQLVSGVLGETPLEDKETAILLLSFVPRAKARGV